MKKGDLKWNTRLIAQNKIQAELVSIMTTKIRQQGLRAFFSRIQGDHGAQIVHPIASRVDPAFSFCQDIFGLWLFCNGERLS